MSNGCNDCGVWSDGRVVDAHHPVGSAVIDAGFVAEWSGQYPVSELEHRLLTDVCSAVNERGFLTRQDLLEVGDWKSKRATGYLGLNSNADVEDVTRLALASPDRLKHRVLTLLRGVGVPVASGVLTVVYPERFTVIDVRAIETLQAFGELTTARPSYGDYLNSCRRVAASAACDLRTLDRALWQWSKNNSRGDSDGLVTA